MEYKRFKQSSIFKKITVFILITIVLQTGLISVLLIKGGVFVQAKESAYTTFYERVKSRKNYVEGEIRNNWTMFEPYISSLSSMVVEFDDKDTFFEESMDVLVPFLRRSQATGAYIILMSDVDKTENIPILYIRDYDPTMNSYSDDDIYMEYGSSKIANDYQIPLDRSWQYTFSMTEENGDFIRKPMMMSQWSAESEYTGYWSKPFKLNKDDVDIMTYSMPLYDDRGKLRGVVGIELIINHLVGFLPAQELQPQDSLGYLIAYKEDPQSELEPIVMNGASQKRFLYEDQPIELSVVDESKNLYTIKNHKGTEELYAVSEKFGLYAYNSPYDEETFYLIGIVRGDYLHNSEKTIISIMRLAIVLALIIGTAGGVFFSYQLGKPFILLSKQVRETQHGNVMDFTPTGLKELDELSRDFAAINRSMMASASRLSKIIEMLELPIAAFEINHSLKQILVTNRFYEILDLDVSEDNMEYGQFLSFIGSIFQVPEEGETDIYPIAEKKRWIRYNQTFNGDVMIGVIIDMTEEMEQKRKILNERDHDSLTGLLNRKGFEEAYVRWKQGFHSGQAALIMMDLDNLKSINDRFGHKWGDKYIIASVRCLVKIAPEDKVIIGRRSGDEFFAVLYGYETKEAIREKIDQFYVQLSETFIYYTDKTQISVSVSAGVKWLIEDELPYEEVLHMADEALYKAKTKGKNHYIEWEDKSL